MRLFHAGFPVGGSNCERVLRRFLTLLATCVLFALTPVFARQSPKPEARDEVPLERCDRLPVVRVHVDGAPLRFLVDTAATSFLNRKTFLGGRPTDVGANSWTGETKTMAREVHLKDFTLGNHTLRGLILPAIELGRIEKACGGRIDGVIGVDLLERFGATIDLQNQVAVLAARRGADGREQQAFEAVRACVDLFNLADWKAWSACVDPEIDWLMRDRDLHGRDDLLVFLESCGKGGCPHAVPRIHMQRFWSTGEVAWFEYTYRIAGTQVDQRGMAIVHRVADRWLLVNVNNSEARARTFPDP